ncbi:helix-turn-helix domain-containing protein [Nitriliruptor alkaliphilus]|uniref:helix-turn-helix domain-containing protein n=1 Tax=Nitriliruptor alkaliphilus TaxID=427918 RepID=UPI0009FB0533|nr:helix-turn-helix domain-containing protein [Nitriliruptor alkaliphilus]
MLTTDDQPAALRHAADDAEPGGVPSRQDAEGALQRALGRRLREARRARGLTLQDVEDRSGGRWKAVVIGSYERGDRAVSAARLTELASFLEVEVAELLADLGRERATGPLGALRFDLEALEVAAEHDPWLQPLVRLVEQIRWQRGDTRSREIAVRHDDLMALGHVLGKDTVELADELAARGVTVR